MVRSAVSGRTRAGGGGRKPNLLITDWLLKDGTDGLATAFNLHKSATCIIFITSMPARIRKKFAISAKLIFSLSTGPIASHGQSLVSSADTTAS
jgi:hypothetical protein